MPGKGQNRYFYNKRKQEKVKKMTIQTEEQGTKKNHKGLWKTIGIIVGAIALLIAVFFISRATMPGTSPTATTEVPPEEATESPASTAAVCDTPSIKAGLTAANTEFGEYLNTNLGERMTFTSRKVVVPAKAWNDPLSAEELKSVEETWLFMQICVPEGMFGRVFASGFEQGTVRYESGVLMTLQPGVYEFKLRNAEVVLWYPADQETFAADDLVRIVEQIKVGNFDIKSPLDFFGVTADLLPSIPDTLVKERNVQIVPFPTAK